MNKTVNERENSPAAGSAPDRVDTTLRDPEFWLFREMPLHLLIPLALFAALASWVALVFDLPLWAVITIGAAVLVLGAMPVRRRFPHNLVGMLAMALAYRWRRARPGPELTGGGDGEPSTGAAFDVPLPEGGGYGMRWDGNLLITMLRIDPPPDALTLLRPGRLSTDQMLPLTEIAKCLGQFDINLSAVDVISTGARTAGNGVIAELYDSIIGPLPAIAHRTVWLVLRLDPLANAQAVDNRGGGATGALRTALIATRRVANRLAALDISVSVLTAGEMNSAVRQLTRGVPLDEFLETPKSLVHGTVHLTSYEIGPDLIGSAGFAQLWATPSANTTITLRLRPGADQEGQRHNRTLDAITVGALVRFDTHFEPSEPPIAGLRTLPGQQFRAMLDCLPARKAVRQSAGAYHGPLTALAGVAVPTAGCGQLIGADATGQGIAVPLVGDGTRHLEVVGKLDLAQQVILRAIAVGARAIVHTDRPEAWHSMVANVDAPHALWLAPRSAGATHHPPQPPAPPVNAPFPHATLVVFDGVPPTTLTGGATIVHVRAPWEPGGDFDADVVLMQDTERPNMITVRTSAVTTTLLMVTTPDEMRYIGESLAAAR
ncbi:type VII secretion protein EccE [Nocardia sp. NPDC050712]|uniref:type VII secretion protein EccE n=1 Tax=Nocardia sp. NPDC050712 TaxID=3155518 RepID=UPI0033FCF21F